MRLCTRVRLHNKLKPNTYTESCMIDETDGWRGRNVWYPGRSVRYRWYYSIGDVTFIIDQEKKTNGIWYKTRVVSLKIRLLTLVLYITVVEWYAKSRRFSARLIRLFIRYSGRRPSHIILSSPYSCARFRIVLAHLLVASNVARYSAFNRAVSLGNTLLWRFRFR